MLSSTLSRFVLSLCFLVLLVAPSLYAQRDQQPRARVTIEDMEFEYIKTPQYELGSNPRTQNTNDDWLRITAEYTAETADEEWLDNVTFNWHVLLIGGETPRLLMHKSVTYMDIETEDPNEKHFATILIRPATLKRYYGETRRISERNILVYLEVLVDKFRISEYTFAKGNPKVPERWWQFREPDVNIIELGLLTRMETPFAPLDFEVYEYIKPETR
jgi:hypothetical protein